MDALRQPGENPVDVPIVCVITRFGLRRARDLLATWRDYRKVMREVRRSQTPGLLRAAFLIENLTTCYSISIWKDYDAIPLFGSNVPQHVIAARRVFGRLSFERERGAEIWSTIWHLTTVSHNLSWDGFDLRSVILSMDRTAAPTGEP